MGTINYGTSDYITIGYDCRGIDSDDYSHVNDCYFQAVEALKKYYFYYFHVTIQPGYYEGFYIDIEHNFSCCYDSSEEKQLAQKEITQLKRFLLECILDFGCCSVYPGWCMGYADRSETLQDLAAAVQEMRQEVRATPTWSRLRVIT